MPRQILPLTPQLLGELPGGCAECVRWELPAVEQERLADASATEVADAKRAVHRDIVQSWGPSGLVVRRGEQVVAHLGYAPPGLLPGSARLPTAPAAPDAVQVTGVYVVPELRGHGLGRLLVHQMAHDLLERPDTPRAVESFGDTRGSAPCLAPADFWLAVGFRVVRPHARTPRLRMDLKAAATWRREVGATLSPWLERLLGGRPVVVPAEREGG